MATLSVAHNYDCTAQTFFFDVILSQAYNTELYAHLGFPHFSFLGVVQDGTKWHRKIRVTPNTGNVPALVQKIVGDGISYVEEGTLDTTTMRFEFRVLPTVFGDKADIRGSIWCTPREGGVVRHARFDAHIKVFAVGSIIEEKMLENYKRSFDEAAVFTRGYLERNNLLAK